MRAVFGSALLLSLLAASPKIAFADPPAASDDGDVQLRSIDYATVRILGVMGVGEAKVTGKKTNVERVVAAVNAGHGSGVVLDNGLVLTAKHVVANAEILAVKVPKDDRVYAARVIYQDPDHDLAFLAIDGKPAAHLTLHAHAKALRAGERVFASGYPLDATQETPALATGQLSRKSNEGLYQLAMSINPGNSGGPVTDDKGELLGIIVQGADPKHGAQGIALAEPVRAILDAYRNVSPAARNQSFDESDVAVARAAYELVVTGPFGISTDDKVDEKLSALGDSNRPLVLALLAAQRWNAIMGLLETHNAKRIDDLKDPHDRETASQILGETVGLCRHAVSIDPSLGERSNFVGDVLSAAVKWESEPGSTEVRAAAQVGTPGEPCDSPSCQESGSHRSRFGITIGAGAPFDGGGFVSQIGVIGDAVRFGHGHVGLALGADGTFGEWRSSFAWAATTDIGFRASIGGKTGIVGGLFYSPGYVQAEGRGMPAWESYRMVGGVYTGSWTFAIAWQEIGRGGDSTLRTLGGSLEMGF